MLRDLDVLDLVGLLDEEAKPRTLAEIHREVGFPFAARAVGPASVAHSIATGTEVRALRWCEHFDAGVVTDLHPFSRGRFRIVSADAETRRWILLGHKS